MLFNNMQRTHVKPLGADHAGDITIKDDVAHHTFCWQCTTRPCGCLYTCVVGVLIQLELVMP
jgi:hypothetical protein